MQACDLANDNSQIQVRDLPVTTRQRIVLTVKTMYIAWTSTVHTSGHITQHIERLQANELPVTSKHKAVAPATSAMS